MHKTVFVAFLVAALAGCLGGSSDGLPLTGAAVTAADLKAGSAYQFVHDGGGLTVSIQGDGEATLTLFDPHDVRLGQLQIGRDLFRQSITIDDARPGEYVIHVDDLNGTLELRSRDAVVPAFQQLDRHFERIILAGRPIESGPLDGFLGPLTNFPSSDPIDEELDFTLLRAPGHLRLLAVGEAYDLVVRVTGSSGTVFQSETFSYYTASGFSVHEIRPLGGQFNAHNVRDASFSAQVSASHFEGYLILEAWTHSRLLPPTPAAVQATHDDIRFVYDQLPDRPVQVQVHDRAQSLFAWRPAMDGGEECGPGSDGNQTGAEACPGAEASEVEPAWVSLFDPADRKLGTYPLLPGDVIRIPVEQGGAYVAVAKAGTVWLGSDRAPTDFQVRILDVAETVVPPEPAGTRNEYVIREGNATAQGVLYGVRPVIGDSPASGGVIGLLDDPVSTFSGCTDEGSIRILQGSETIGFWGSGVDSSLHHADLFLQPGDIRFVQDGMGGTCGHAALNLLGYIR